MPEIFNANNAAKTIVKTPTRPRVSPTMHHPLSAFIVKPDNIFFETQTDQEQIVLFLRQHPVVNSAWIILTVLLALLPAFVMPFLGNIFPSLPGGYFLILPLIWYLGVFGYALVSFLHWYFNIYIVTNQRVVDIDWVNLLYKQFTSAELERVQDVTFKQGGIFDLFFNYGDVFIQTAGTEQNLEFERVPKPDDIVEQINKLVEEHP